MQYIVHSNIWISLAAVALMWATDVLANHQLSSSHLYSIVFFSTLLTYNWQRMLSVKKRQEKQAVSNLSSWVGGNLVSGIVASLFALAVCTFNFFHLAKNQQAALVVLGLVSVVYALPLLPSPRGRIRLRDFGFTKPLVLGVSWGLVCTWLPLIVPSAHYLHFPLPAQIDIVIIANCITMIGICIPFDIKDITFDRATMAYPTLPVWLGVRKALWLAMAFSVLGFIIFSTWAWQSNLGWLIIAAAFISLVVECWFINKTNAESTEWYYVMVLDGLILLRAGLLVGAVWVTDFIATTF